MLVLIGVGFLAGLVTGVSPCIVPVVPVIVAAGATGGDRRRPYLVVAGLVATFTAATLIGLEVLSWLHLPDDLLNRAGIVLLLILGIGLVIPFIGDWIERPFARVRLGTPKTRSSGLLLGAGLGLVFVPCAGPVLATITTVAEAHRVGPTVLFMTVAYAIGACIPLLALALASKKATETLRAFKAHARAVRQWSGILIVGSAIALWAGLFTPLQTAVPGYTNILQNRIEGSSSVATRLEGLKGENGPKELGRLAPTVGANLMDYGQAPNFTGITAWLNTPGNRPLTIQQLRGKVVLVDFWTYSCINCERSLPHVEAWYKAYHSDGFVVVGVHTPEFAFEHVVSNVVSAAKKLGVDYPIAIDDNYATWNAYQNQYWPAEYLIDQQGVIRREEFGEGNYAGTETAIRALLQAGGATNLPPPTDVPNLTPTSIGSPETYVGYDRLQDESFEANPTLEVNQTATYQLPSQLPPLTLAFGGTWRVNSQEATAGRNAKLELSYDAADVYLVLGGTGTIHVSVNGHESTTVHVSGVPGLYTMVGTNSEQTGLLKLTFSPGIEAYDFTFG
jgi:cytochrome c biogenesis protein CcdA/thiol-disulfide isomerase/thioredoxin